MATAEITVALAALSVLVLVMTWLVMVVGMQMRCVDAARDGARAAARGEPRAVTEAEALRTAPDGASVTVSVAGDRVTVEVSAEADPPWPLLSGFPLAMVSGRAVVAVEPGLGVAGSVTGSVTDSVAGRSSPQGGAR